MANRKPQRTRRSGVLLHVTSLPGPFGVGDLGPAAVRWVDALATAKQGWWQILPLSPPGDGNSPYQAYSAFAGNPALISPERLAEENLLTAQELASAKLPAGRADFERATANKSRLLTLAWDRFSSGTAKSLRRPFEKFAADAAGWLDDFALFMALKEANRGVAWTDWPKALVRREPAALAEARRDLADAVGRHRFTQFLFYRQLEQLRAHARERGVRLIGDLPIFVSADSADVWVHPELFLLNRQRQPTAVAGVPPDMFSATGQRWGNPLYDWTAMRTDGFRWWVERCRAVLRQVDLVRIDHFRGFEAYWKIPAHHPTAQYGRWVKAPGAELFQTLEKQLGGLPFIAEDLGVITPRVDALRDAFRLPGMRVLQFAFGNDDNLYLPHNHRRNCVVYTGTHDNDTTAGWHASLNKHDRARLRRYAPQVDAAPATELIRLAWSSVADLAIAPLQDVLSLGNEARMNVPGTARGNWGWRFTDKMLSRSAMDRLGEMTEAYARQP